MKKAIYKRLVHPIPKHKAHDVVSALQIVCDVIYFPRLRCLLAGLCDLDDIIITL